MDDTSSPDHRPTGPPRRPPGRTARLALLGGLAAGVGFAAVTGISAASGTGARPTSANLSVAKAPRRTPTRPPGPWGGPGGEGTITAITARANGGDTLTVRTMGGDETVVTTTTTKVTGPDLQSATLSSSDVGRVVRVIGKPPAGSATSGSGSGAAAPTELDAVALRLVDPTVVGKVTAVGSNGYTLVGPDGQRITVTTSSSTRYVTGTADGRPTTTTTAPGYAVGDLVFASGPETTTGTQSASTPTTTVDAVLMGRAPAGPHGPGRLGGPWGPLGGRHGSGPLGGQHGSGPLGGPWGPAGPGGAGDPGSNAPTAA